MAGDPSGLWKTTTEPNHPTPPRQDHRTQGQEGGPETEDPCRRATETKQTNHRKVRDQQTQKDIRFRNDTKEDT